MVAAEDHSGRGEKWCRASKVSAGCYPGISEVVRRAEDAFKRGEALRVGGERAGAAGG